MTHDLSFFLPQIDRALDRLPPESPVSVLLTSFMSNAVAGRAASSMYFSLYILRTD